MSSNKYSMLTFVSAGDSFTYGTELSDCERIYSQLSWAGLTAKNLNMKYKCSAFPGSSNASIARRCIFEIENLIKQDTKILVGVMWTNIYRIELYPTKKFGNSDGYETASNFHSFTFEEKSAIFNKDNDPSVNKWLETSHNECEETGIAAISRNFVKYMDDTFYVMNTLKSMMLLRYYLEFNNIDYFFIKAVDTLHYGTQDPYCSTFRNIVNGAKWLNVPDFKDWAEAHNFNKGSGGHPLDEAHLAYSEQYILPFLKSKGYGVS